MLNIWIRNVCKCFSPLCKMPLSTDPSYLMLLFKQLHGWLASITHSDCTGHYLGYILLSLWSLTEELIFPLGSSLQTAITYLLLPLSPCPSVPVLRGRHRPGLGLVLPSMQQLVRNRETLTADIIWAGMKWLGQTQWHWYSRVLSTPTGHFDNIFIGIYAARNDFKKNTTVHLKCIQSPSAGTRQQRALLSTEVHKKVEKYLCKCLSCNKPRKYNWKTVRRIEII